MSLQVLLAARLRRLNGQISALSRKTAAMLAERLNWEPGSVLQGIRATDCCSPIFSTGATIAQGREQVHAAALPRVAGRLPPSLASRPQGSLAVWPLTPSAPSG
ncbi:hypothetical protein E0493_15650 [Roseomonas sp. M0104]|uniref:Uncharacterized protein n=1 Tax=Teichococcus coralli TaxID=2545983 RepID=A0A845BHJ6_9PROT|nr:hypothetical protein [Pseudoroseomonas coralli]MXP64787.1 hypothetical protein [Pseudoroseomonas coralli]